MDSNSNLRPLFDDEPLPIREAQGDLNFRTRKKTNAHRVPQRLVEHAIRHVLDNHKEKWHKHLPCGLVLIDLMRDFISETLASSKSDRKPNTNWLSEDEYRKLCRNPNFRQLCEEYRNYASSYLNKACLEFREHIHYDASDDRGRRCEQIDLLSKKDKIRIVAKSLVRKGKLSPYYLQTAYRFTVEDNERLNGKVQERQKRMLCSRLTSPNILAIHDQLPNGEKSND